jgi:ankyrin repeat protein
MSRRRQLEARATAALLLALAVTLSGFLQWRHHQAELRRQLLSILDSPFTERREVERQVTAIGELLKQGLDPNSRDRSGTPLLIWAFERRRFDLIDDVLRRGGNVDVTGARRWTALMMAADRADLPDLKFLLARGAGVQTRGTGKAALRCAWRGKRSTWNGSIALISCAC